jgi:hypothetical protein
MSARYFLLIPATAVICGALLGHFPSAQAVHALATPEAVNAPAAPAAPAPPAPAVPDPTAPVPAVPAPAIPVPAAPAPAAPASAALAAAPPAAAPAAAPELTGLWRGLIVYKHAENEFELVVEIFRGADGKLQGTVDLPSEHISYRPLRNIVVAGRRLSMEFLNDSEVRGPEATFKLEGELGADGKTMRGLFVELGGRVPFEIERQGEPGGERPPAVPAPLQALADSADQLKAAFNRDAGKVRLVLLLSPT